MDETPKRNLDGITPVRSVDGVVRSSRAQTPTQAPPPPVVSEPEFAPVASLASPQPKPMKRQVTPVNPPEPPVAQDPQSKPKGIVRRLLKFLLGLIVIAAVLVGLWFLYLHFYA